MEELLEGSCVVVSSGSGTSADQKDGSTAKEAPDPESTAELLELVRAGDDRARDRLVERYLPLLQRWGHGRLPGTVRGMVDTDDLVQVSLMRALRHVATFESCREGAFLAYLRTILLNAVRDEIRRSARRREDALPPTEIEDPSPSLVERTIGRELLERYERALETLEEDQREAVILRLELDYTYQEIAVAIGSPSANAARMKVSRALVRMAEAMGDA